MTPSYDDRRANPQPCRCGLLVTQSDYCEAQQRCLMTLHPQARPPEAATWDDLNDRHPHEKAATP